MMKVSRRLGTILVTVAREDSWFKTCSYLVDSSQGHLDVVRVVESQSEC